MSNFPNANEYGGPAGNGYQSMNLNAALARAGNGIHGNDLAQMAGPGRRPVIIADGQARMVDQSRFYGASELRDRRGRPVKISSMPDRTKGMAASESVLVFLDYANIAAGARPFQRVDYGAMLEYLSEGRFLIDGYAYVPIDPRRPEARRGLVRSLQESGWLVNQKMGKISGDSYKSNVDVEMCIDIMRSAQGIRPDIIVLCSGDGDFIPVIRELRRMGIRAEVASFEQSADTAMSYEASGFISLDVWRDEIGETDELHNAWRDREACQNAPGGGAVPETDLPEDSGYGGEDPTDSPRPGDSDLPQSPTGREA